ncbi:MAG: ABC transporter permease subunit [Rhodothermales bacterium]|nr:ABC transporter permease subunit [Rhodothermales bacterium]
MTLRLFRLLTLALLVVVAVSCSGDPASGLGDPVVVGSKSFTESIILGEVIAGVLQSTGTPVEHRRSLGGTRFLWSGLLSGEIDVYPDYSGTILREILAAEPYANLSVALPHLDSLGIEFTAPLGFNNTYALGMSEARAAELGIENITDLVDHPDLRLGFSNEFMDRGDGWPALRTAYRLPHESVQGVDHDLAYRGLEGGSIDVIDLYSTDAEIAYYGLRTLTDDRSHFPRYDAVVLYRKDLAERHPTLVDLLVGLEGAITEEEMTDMNRRVKIAGESELAVAAQFLRRKLSIVTSDMGPEPSRFGRVWQRTVEHLILVGISLGLAILVAIPLGVLAARRRRLGQIILGTVGVIYTIPALALLVFMIPLIGIGGPPAVVALFLYSLLPIVRNTYTGLTDIPVPLSESATALGLEPVARLRLIELPLASRSILGGIKTSAVINIGTATLGALIGAGGYGQPILTGIRLDDVGLILEGAVPAALLALVAQGVFDLVERLAVPRGLRMA